MELGIAAWVRAYYRICLKNNSKMPLNHSQLEKRYCDVDPDERAGCA
jgi:hypothetical protein